MTLESKGIDRTTINPTILLLVQQIRSSNPHLTNQEVARELLYQAEKWTKKVRAGKA